jgi:hypothetical protein
LNESVVVERPTRTGDDCGRGDQLESRFAGVSRWVDVRRPVGGAFVAGRPIGQSFGGRAGQRSEAGLVGVSGASGFGELIVDFEDDALGFVFTALGWNCPFLNCGNSVQGATPWMVALSPLPLVLVVTSATPASASWSSA